MMTIIFLPFDLVKSKKDSVENGGVLFDFYKMQIYGGRKHAVKERV